MIRLDASQEKTQKFSPFTTAIVFGVFAIFAPHHIILTPSDITIHSPLWSANISQFEWAPIPTSLSYFFVLSFFVLLILTLRAAFGLQASKYYQGATTRSRTLLVGVMSSFIELILCQSTFRVLMALMRLPNSFGDSPMTSFLIIPLPVLFVFGVILLWIKPMPQITPLPLRKEPIIIFSVIVLVPLSSFYNIFGESFLVIIFIAILVGIESIRK